MLALMCAVVSAQRLPEDLTWNDVPGTTAIFATWHEGAQPYYAVSRDGGETIAVHPADYSIHLRYAKFEPLQGQPIVPPILEATSASNLYIVQFVTQGLEAYRRTLGALGAEVCHFIANYSAVVRMDPTTLASVRRLPFVRWTGHFHPAYRIDEVMRSEVLAGTMPTRKYNIHVTKKGLAEREAVRAHILAIGGTPNEYTSPHGFLLTAELDAVQLLSIAYRDDVLFVDRWTAPENDMDNARMVFGADYVESVAGYTGAGVRAEVMDSGLLETHSDFQNPVPPIVQNNSSSTSHGTSVYGIVFGDGTGDPTARGVMPDAQGIFSAYGNLGDRYVHTQNLVQNLDAIFQTNSWGGGRTFFYTNVSADMDNLLFDHDIVILQSQSNAGNQDSRPQAWAKNIVSVGAFRHYDTASLADDAWAGGASIGPAADGRIKPDLSAFYDLTRTTSSSGGYTNSFGGTSGATPITAGHMGLFHQMWADGIFGNPITGTSVFADRPHMTTAKAMLINHASQYPFSGLGVDMARVHQAWGRPDLQKMYDGRNRLFIVDETDVLVNLSAMSYSLTVTPADNEFRATMIYADPAGNPAGAVHRINNLSLRVVDPNNNVYWGNEGLMTGNWSTIGGSENDIDTVENVYVDNPTPGTWTVEVLATELNADGHTETPAIDADFALVVSGVDPPPPPVQDTGNPNSLDAALRIAGATNINGFGAINGINGPFFKALAAGDQLAMQFESLPNRVFLLLFGALNRNNAVFAGVGSLDIGLQGAGNLTDIQIVMDGLNGGTFFDSLANVGAAGTQSLSLPVASLPPGIFGTFQAAFLDAGNTATLKLSAATEVSIQ